MDVPTTALAGYTASPFAYDGTEHLVYRRGTGPAVIVLAEIPGITPRVAAFADRLVDRGATAVLPHLFGTPGRGVPDDRLAALRLLGTVGLEVCVSREFTVFATGRSSPVVRWLRALADEEHGRCGGPGVGVVGMCFTGGFALAVATDPAVVASVLSQPSLPVAVTPRRRATVDCSPTELGTVARRCRDDELGVVALRFRSDRLVPAERFAFLRRHLGERFVAVELDDAAADPQAAGPPHSVLTEHLVDRPGEPTHDALVLVLDHLTDRLHLDRTPTTGA